MAGNNILVINASGAETRVALVENGTIHEYYLERKREKGIVGNIYKGRVVRVLPGMQAAFVDIGLEKAAFLYVGDVYGDPDFSEEFELTEGEHSAETPDVPDEHEAEEAEARAARAAEQPALTPGHGIDMASPPESPEVAPTSPTGAEGQGEGAAVTTPAQDAAAAEGQPTVTSLSPTGGEVPPSSTSLSPTGGEGQGAGAIAPVEELPPPRLTPIPLTNAIGNLPVAGVPSLMVPELPPLDAGAEVQPSLPPTGGEAQGEGAGAVQPEAAAPHAPVAPETSTPEPAPAPEAAQVTVKPPEAAREVRGDRDRE
ncbi:MAG TPA: ribonuclease G, partial [Anaeromyxobacteraceae bacterium]|nr:ribonuclease G [Anaeromyxobacteraceae bacterium]